MKKFLFTLLAFFVLFLNEGLAGSPIGGGPVGTGGGGGAAVPETDPIVGAVTGLVEADGGGNISAATPGVDYIAAEADPIVGAITGIIEADGVGNISAATPGVDYVATERELSKQAYTADGNISEAQVLANKYLCNQGDADEADLVLPALSYAVGVIFIIEEVQNIEINPPVGESFDLDGVTLDADDCVDSDSTVGSKIAVTRHQIADASWVWSLDTIRGAWADTGASD